MTLAIKFWIPFQVSDVGNWKTPDVVIAEITVLTSNDIIVVYVDDVALCGRCYNYSVGNAGVFVEYGEVQVKKFEVLEGEEQNIMG